MKRITVLAFVLFGLVFEVQSGPVDSNSTVIAAERRETVDLAKRATVHEDTECFKENLRTSGPVLKQVTYTSDDDCEELCLTVDGCQAIVTSPMYWAVTGCYIIGEYTLSTNNARGWDTAERKCFDPHTVHKDVDCFKNNLRTSGPVLNEVTYTSDDDCEELCKTTDGCQAVVTSPMYWAVTGCYIIGEYTLTTNNARGWDTAERKCFDPQFANGGPDKPDPEWQCHNYTRWDWSWKKRNDATEAEMCERWERRRYSGGNNANYLGCEDCHCCKPR